jgi:RNA polymerase sigma-70 factor (ECF subfamily)
MAHAGGFIRAADQLESGTKHGRFQACTRLDAGPASQSMTAWAVRRAREGDPEAMRYLYVRYADNVFGYVRSIVRDEDDAEDVTQQVFAKLMVVIVRYEQRSMPFSAWILRVAHNAAIDYMRGRHAFPCEQVRDVDAPDDNRATECRRDFYDALTSLTEEQRSVLVLRLVVGLAPGEIAERMGKSEDAIHALHYRGRRNLRRSLVAMSASPMAAA